MKKLFLLLLCSMRLIAHASIASPNFQSNVSESFFYGSAGVFTAYMLPLPTVGLGYRYQYNHIGLDFSADATTLIFFSALRLAPALLFYPKPNNVSEWYLGFSCSNLFLNLGNVYRPEAPSTNHFFCLPELVVGYQYKRSSGLNNFVEFRVGAPIIRHRECDCCNEARHSNPMVIPCVSLKYGFSF